MSRKFSIVSTVNLDVLYDEIEDYISCTGNFNPYIFMSEETARAIEKELPPVKWLNPSLKSQYKDKNSKYTDATFAGYKLFINNSLRFGIVELR